MPTGRDVVVAVPGLAGGVDEAVRHLFTSDEMRDRWRIHVLTTKGQRPLLAPVVFAGALMRLVWLRLRGRVDLVHLNVSFRGSTLRKCIVGLVARAIRVPYIVQVHSGGYEGFYRGLPDLPARQVRALFHGASQVVVLGSVFRGLVEGVIGVPVERVSVLPNAVDPAPTPVEDPSGGSRPGNEPVILFTGRLWAKKGVYDLLEALARIEDLGWQVVLVGDGEVDQVERRVGALGLQGRVDVRPWQDRATIDRLLATSSVFVHPSYVEALSVSLLEAMAAGLCCLATEVGAHGEILDDGQNALVIEPGDVTMLADRLTKAITDADLRRKLGRQAGRTIETGYSIPVISRGLSDIYDQILVDFPREDGSTAVSP